MKYLILLFISLLLLTLNVQCLANAIENSPSLNNDSIVNKNKVPDEKGLDLIVMAGSGIAWDRDFWGQQFNYAPTVTLGLEIPFTKAHHFSVELFAHSWLTKAISSNNIDYLNMKYINLNDGMYSQIGLSAIIKAYLGNKNSKFRLSFHFGWLFLRPKQDYYAIDIGTGIYFKLNDNFSLSFGFSDLFKIPDFGGGTTQTTPNLYTLNLCYKFKLVL
ncbi:MAG: hypothetical protein HW421_757 [Ignavibacteria bacterium]|nr:hypothetical protein [Ignavibacteria bacterium]